MKKNSMLVIILLSLFFLITLALIRFWSKNKNLKARSETPQMTNDVTENKRIEIVNDQVIDSGKMMDIIDPVWYGIIIYDGPQKYQADQLKFSLPQRYVLAMIWYVAEVNNGGHDQFYFNSTGIVWKDALEGFKFFKLDDYAQILTESVNLMGGDPSLDREKRQQQLDSLQPDFNELDNRFYKLDEFDSVILDYVKKNRQEFYFPPTKI